MKNLGFMCAKHSYDHPRVLKCIYMKLPRILKHFQPIFSVVAQHHAVVQHPFVAQHDAEPQV